MDFKKDFPIFQHRPELVYLDNAATTQKPETVLKAIQDYYLRLNSNIHRSAHYLAEEATMAYEESRQATADFINAESKHEIIFTRNATESINLVARTYGETFLEEGDEILLSLLEHHSNTVPWLQLKEKKGVKINYLNIDDKGQLIFDPESITQKTKLVCLTAMSNALGTTPNLKPIIKKAHELGAKILVDACQLIAHQKIDVQELDVDFLVFSAHKMYGPTGVGVLYAKEEWLNQMPAFLGGGEMIQEVFKDHFIAGPLPSKFEAGTPNIEGVITFKSALDYLNTIGLETIGKKEAELSAYTLEKLSSLPYLDLHSRKDQANSIFAFTMQNVHPHDVAEGMSSKKICIRSGHLCCQILMDHLNLPAISRLSLAFYNDKTDIDKAIQAIEETHQYFS
jgi:cysteine desulfurase/selenocysteine lyase